MKYNINQVVPNTSALGTVGIDDILISPTTLGWVYKVVVKESLMVTYLTEEELDDTMEVENELPN